MIKRSTAEVARRILQQTPASLLRLLAVLPPQLHTLAIEARTLTAPNIQGSSLCLADVKDLPCARVAPALDAFLLRASPLQHVQSLTLAKAAGASEASAATLARALPLLAALTRLVVSDCGFASEGGGAIVRAAAELPRLAALDFSGNKLGLAGLQAFSDWPSASSALTELSLARNDLRMAGMHHLPAVLLHMPALQTLDFSGNTTEDNFRDACYNEDHQDAELCHPPQLRDLCISITDLVLPFSALAAQLPHLTRLRVLPMTVDPGNLLLRDVGPEACAMLRELRLSAALRPTDLPRLALTHLTTLALLVVYWAGQGEGDDAWLPAAANVLAQMPQLQELSLMPLEEGNSVAPDANIAAAAALARCLHSLTQLTRLELGCFFQLSSVASTEALIAKLGRLSALQSLTLGVLCGIPALPAAARAALVQLRHLKFIAPGPEACVQADALETWAASTLMQSLDVGGRTTGIAESAGCSIATNPHAPASAGHLGSRVVAERQRACCHAARCAGVCDGAALSRAQPTDAQLCRRAGAMARDLALHAADGCACACHPTTRPKSWRQLPRRTCSCCRTCGSSACSASLVTRQRRRAALRRASKRRCCA